MKARYFVSMVFAIIIIVFICIISGLSFGAIWLIDLPSALIMIIFPLVFLWILHGWKNIRSAFFIFCKIDTNKDELLNAKVFFENYSKALFSIAFIGFIISFISMMHYLESKELLGPKMAFASIMLLYAGIINLLIIIPYKIIINKKLIEIKE